MCPVAAESKNSNSSSKRKINKKINTNLESVVEENSNNKSQNLSTIFAQQITAGFIKFVLQLRCGTYWLRTEKIAIYLWEVDINIV